MDNSLKINVFLIPDEGQRFSFSENDDWFRGCFPPGGKPDFAVEKVDATFLVTKTSGAIYIKGSFSALVDICCSRCLENVDLSIGTDFDYTMMPRKVETAEEIELKAEELEISYYEGDFIDLAPILCEQIILQIPMKVLCSEDCKGLCPNCGANLNTDPCNCRSELADNRWAVLKNFKVKN
ncbi:MAG TPA: DUF177 domain-containing protein [Smithella sp.]|nr:DUF177 domain-containing protein [Smithella sp.]